jgi:acyl-lipid omega-6 desaturase (Delta-12 desaturase)
MTTIEAQLAATKLRVPVNDIATEGRTWAKTLAAYRTPSLPRTLFELAATAAPLLALWAAAWVLVVFEQWWGLALVAPCAVFLVRLFMIQHDCGHGSLFRSKTANDWVGRIAGVFTLTPYDHWKRTHAIHHGTHGNLDRRELGGIELLTVAEYHALSPFRRFMYRLYRHPLILFGVGPAYLFIFQHRIPFGEMKAGARPWVETMATNLAIAAFAVALIWIGGVGPFLMVNLPVLLLAATIGVWLFYVQHQFEQTHWRRAENWDLHQAALMGSTHLALPRPLAWLTANIGIHHAHHLNSRIPFYRLPQVIRDHPELGQVQRLTLRESLHCTRLALWSEERQRMVSFRDARMAQA